MRIKRKAQKSVLTRLTILAHTVFRFSLLEVISSHKKHSSDQVSGRYTLSTLNFSKKIIVSLMDVNYLSKHVYQHSPISLCRLHQMVRVISVNSCRDVVCKILKIMNY